MARAWGVQRKWHRDLSGHAMLYAGRMAAESARGFRSTAAVVNGLPAVAHRDIRWSCGYLRYTCGVEGDSWDRADDVDALHPGFPEEGILPQDDPAREDLEAQEAAQERTAGGHGPAERGS